MLTVFRAKEGSCSEDQSCSTSCPGQTTAVSGPSQAASRTTLVFHVATHVGSCSSIRSVQLTAMNAKLTLQLSDLHQLQQVDKPVHHLWVRSRL